MAPTYDAARRLKREGETDRDRGVLEEHGTIRFIGFLDEWSSATEVRADEDSATTRARNTAA
jgi:hypothetical protein